MPDSAAAEISALLQPGARDPRSILLLLRPKLLTARARARQSERGRSARRIVLGVLGLLFWAAIFGVAHRLLSYFRDVPEIGPLLAGKLLGVVMLCFLSILLLSNVITSLSTFFLARDLDLLAAAPLDWLHVYLAKLGETTLHSSWMLALMSAPIFAAYGLAYDGGWFFPLVVIGIFLPLLAIPAALGAMITLLLVNVFPARRARDILGVITVFAAAGVVVLIRLVRPEQLARPEGFRSLVEFVAVLQTPSSPFLPSEWVQEAVMGWLTFTPTPLALYLLWTTASAVVVLGAIAHHSFYRMGFSRAQESGGQSPAATRLAEMGTRLLAPIGPLRRELVLKELRLFFRDTTQWSQLILLGVLVVVYVANVKFLPLGSEGVTRLLASVIPFLNLAVTAFVLASVAARFLFPGVSVEGRTLWLLRSSPLRMRDLLWAKYWVGTMPLLLLAGVLVSATNLLLQVPAFMFAVTLGTVFALTFAIAGLAVGFGALFPRYESESVAQIPTSFGGLVFMMTAIALIAGVIILQARPVYRYAMAVWMNAPAPAGPLVVGFALAALLCAVTTIVPMRVALRRLEG